MNPLKRLSVLVLLALLSVGCNQSTDTPSAPATSAATANAATPSGKTTAKTTAVGTKGPKKAAPSTTESAAPPAERKPGELPFEYGTSKTDAKAGDFVLAPAKSVIERSFKAKVPSYIYYGATMVEPGEVQSKIQTLTKKEYMVPNTLIVPVGGDYSANVGDTLLTRWEGGSGMQRAYVVDVDAKEKVPVVRFLDIHLNSPSKWGTRDAKLKPGRFRPLSKEGQVGTSVAYQERGQWRHGVIMHKLDGKMLVRSWAGRMSVVKEGDGKLLPIKPEAKAGQKVWVPAFGTFKEATVSKMDSKIGRVFAKYRMAGKEKEEGFAFGDVLTEAP